MSVILSGKLAAIKADLETMLARWSTTLAGRIDAAISSRAAASTALSTSVWTPTKAGYLDAAISGIVGGGNSEIFLVSGTFDVPSGVRYVRVTLCGAGGGGAVRDYLDEGGGGGGGAEWYRGHSIDLGATPPSTVTVTLGAVAPAITAQANGADGGDSTFGSYLTALGGSGGLVDGDGGDSGGYLNEGGGTGSQGSQNPAIGNPERARNPFHGGGGGGGGGISGVGGGNGTAGGFTYWSQGGTAHNEDWHGGGGGASLGRGGSFNEYYPDWGGGSAGVHDTMNTRDSGSPICIIEWGV